MPTYEYRCAKCGDFDFVQKISDEALKSCPSCGQPVHRILSAIPFHLKGGGWYKTEYGSASNGNGKSSGKATTCPMKEKGSGESETEAPCAKCPNAKVED